MRPMTLNMSKVKKISGDKKSSTFKHEDGHEIKVLHSALPALQRKQLEKMPCYADGGDVDPGQDDQEPTFPAPQRFADGTDNVQYAGGGSNASTPIVTPTPPPPPPAANAQVTDMFHNAFGAKGTKQYADGISAASPNDSAPTQTAPPVITSPASVYGGQQVQTQPQPVPPTNSPIGGNGLLNGPAAVNMQQKAAREQQAVDSAKGATQANIEDGFVKQRAAIAQQDQENIQALKQHTDDFNNYVQNNQINPNHYMESKSSGSKVATAMGLFLGGFGTTRGGTNSAQTFLNSQIDRDIAAQQKRVDNQQSVYKAYESLYGNQNIATGLSKVSMNDIYTHKMQQMAAQLGTPQAKANADAFAAQKAIENAQVLANTSQNAGISTQQYGKSQSSPQQPPTEPSQQPDMDQMKGAKEEKGFKPSSEITPDADKKLSSLQYGTDQMKGDYKPTMDSLNALRQAEANIGGIKKTFLDAAERTEKGGVGGRIGRAFEPSTVGALPGGRGEGASNWITGAVDAIKEPVYKLASTENTRAIDQNRSDIKKYVANALSGTNLGSGDINKYVDDHMPEYGDSAIRMKEKRDALIEYINANLEPMRTLPKKYNLLSPKKP